jgi:UPF0755 protein
VFLLTAGGLGWILFSRFSAYEGEAVVDIPPRTSTTKMAQALEQAGVIRSQWGFLLTRALRRGINLQAGEYQFTTPMSVWEVFSKIARGDVYYHELRVPEGSNIFDIAASIDKMGLMKAEEFLHASKDPSLIRDIAPTAPSLEGYLFPSTYRITRRTSATNVAREMTQNFRRVWDKIGRPDVDVNRVITLASLVEKETAIPAERPTVASVYQNRLKMAMRLDCDPTTIYAALLEGRFRGTIYRSDLDNPHPYNTYRNPGLPPGPIANPGLDSIRAALNPADTSYLFFVAKPDGSGAHVFTETLQEHNAEVRNFRSGQR